MCERGIYVREERELRHEGRVEREEKRGNMGKE